MQTSDYKMGKALIMNDMLITNSIYVDIEFLKYIKLGLLLSHQNLTPILYTAIAKIVFNEAFASRYTDDPQSLFKEVPEVASLLEVQNNKTDDVVFSISPAFSGGVEVIQNCIIISDSSKRMMNLKKPTMVTIDISPIKDLSERMCKRLIAEYEILFDTEVKLLHDGIGSLSPTAASDFDIYYVSDLGRFNAVMIDQLNAEALGSKHMVCSKLLPLSKLHNLPIEQVPITFANIELVMAAATKFHFIAPFVCLT